MGETVNLSPAPRSGEGRPRAWRPGVAIWLSAGFHVLALIALLARPQWWVAILTAVVLNHVVLALIGLWPRSRLLGANMLRLPDAAASRNEIALTFDDGPDPDVTPQVLDILDSHHAKASFFVIGDKAAAYPDLIREIVRRGHSIENHSRKHSSFFGFFTWTALRKDIGATQEIVAAVTGQPPTFFRSPMGIRNPLLDPVIARLGLRYVTWTRRGFDTVAGDPAVVLDRLTRKSVGGRHPVASRPRDTHATGHRSRCPACIAGQNCRRGTETGFVADGNALMRPEIGALIDAASKPYLAAGQYAYHFARAKLRHDPGIHRAVAFGAHPRSGTGAGSRLRAGPRCIAHAGGARAVRSRTLACRMGCAAFGIAIARHRIGAQSGAAGTRRPG